MDSTTSNGKLIATSIIVAAIVIAGAIIYQPTNKPFFAPPKADPSLFGPRFEVTADDDAVLGDPNAPVTIVIFGDYECPYCKKAADTAEAQIRKEYVATGKVKLAFRDFPLDNIHTEARPAAEAAQCAAPQGKYWEYHDALFARQKELRALDYVALASELSLNVSDFQKCLKQGTFKEEVSRDLEAGRALGIEGTPASYINGYLITGAYPFAAYQQIIEHELQARK